ncbi:unnamed protein product [Linum trigynum]|uniref:protein-disulfide reductase n=1 Tax=Linum trigynum TaxID=586398 RepID=A0AAV2C9V0_9ROSI
MDYVSLVFINRLENPIKHRSSDAGSKLDVFTMAGDNTTTEQESNDFFNLLASRGIDFLLSSQGKVPISSACEESRVVCLFFSANWCRPCKTFTPQLIQLYHTLKSEGKSLEIIFISFDHDENQFEEHFMSMPWLALPFEAELHKMLRDIYRVLRIPSLIPLLTDGITVEEDLISFVEDYGSEAFPFTRKRREELKAIDDAKRQGGSLEQLLGHQGRSFLLTRDYRKVSVSQLVGKPIGLYFGAHWCPPSRNFTAQLIEAYNDLNTTNNNDDSSSSRTFEVVFISTDRDIKEFNVSLSNMPWLAIPYDDRTRQDLCRIFDIKGIPALVMIGEDGKTVSTEGKSLISLYGAMGFPFTAARVAEIQAAVRKEGEALPREVKDSRKHEHVLKLDMAKGYVCDWCKRQGRFWAFSCDVCDYDLHPACVEET